MIKDYIRNNFHYNPKTGQLFRKFKNYSKIIGSKDKKGYLIVGVNNKVIQIHRIAWFLYYGYFPTCEMDHKNRIKSDNRIENLRLVSNSENQWNRGIQKNNCTGFKGVHYRDKQKTFAAQIMVN